MIVKFQSPIVIKRKKQGTVQLLCFHCGVKYETSYENLRVDNYCTDC